MARAVTAVMAGFEPPRDRTGLAALYTAVHSESGETFTVFDRGQSRLVTLPWSPHDGFPREGLPRSFDATHRHHKGGRYMKLYPIWRGDTDEKLVAYMGCDRKVWLRPAAMFAETLPDGRKRFARIPAPGPDDLAGHKGFVRRILHAGDDLGGHPAIRAAVAAELGDTLAFVVRTRLARDGAAPPRGHEWTYAEEEDFALAGDMAKTVLRWRPERLALASAPWRGVSLVLREDGVVYLEGGFSAIAVAMAEASRGGKGAVSYLTRAGSAVAGAEAAPRRARSWKAALARMTATVARGFGAEFAPVDGRAP